MNGSTLFWTVFSAVLCSGMLLIAFVWAAVNVSRKEQAREPLGLYLATMLMVFAFAGSSFMIATDSVPAWLDAMAK